MSCVKLTLCASDGTKAIGVFRTDDKTPIAYFDPSLSQAYAGDTSALGACECEKIEGSKAKIANGDDIRIALLGDSWVDLGVQNNTQIYQDLDAWVKSLGSDGGTGFIELNDPIVSLAGSWIDRNQALQGISYGLQTQHFETTDVAASLSVTASGDIVSVEYICRPGGGTFRFRVDSGSWQTVDTDSQLSYKTTSIVASAGASHLLELEITSAGTAGVFLGGVSFINATGSLVHEYGNGGLSSREVVQNFGDPVAKQMWQDALIASDSDLLIVLFGTNDQGEGALPSAYAQNMQLIKDCAQEAVPGIEVMLVSSGDNGRDPAAEFEMQEYTDALLQTSDPLDCSFCILDGMEVLGPYSATNGLWLNATHPSLAGSSLYADAVIAKLQG